MWRRLQALPAHARGALLDHRIALLAEGALRVRVIEGRLQRHGIELAGNRARGPAIGCELTLVVFFLAARLRIDVALCVVAAFVRQDEAIEVLIAHAVLADIDHRPVRPDHRKAAIGH